MLNIIVASIFETGFFGVFIAVGIWIFLIQILFWGFLFFDFIKNHWKTIGVTTCIYILFLLIIFWTKGEIKHEVKYEPWMEGQNIPGMHKPIQ